LVNIYPTFFAADEVWGSFVCFMEKGDIHLFHGILCKDYSNLMNFQKLIDNYSCLFNLHAKGANKANFLEIKICVFHLFAKFALKNFAMQKP